MAEEGSAAPTVGGGDVAAPSTPVEATGSAQASASTGNAPGGGGDAGVAGTETGSPASVSAAQFSFLRRQFRDQKHAEEVLGSEIGMTRGLQRQVAEMQKRVQAYEAELGALRPLVVERQAQGRGQEGAGVSQAPGAPKSFARELVESGELDVIAKIFADPEMGPAHAMYRMAELLDQRNSQQLEQVRDEVRSEFGRATVRSQQERAVAKAIGATNSLKADYPELDPQNQSDEAIEAQQAILEILKSLPQGSEWLASDPSEALRYAAERYRRMHGTPIFAQPPGTSGSPSGRIAQAAEAQANGAGAVLDGSGVPRQKTNGVPEGAQDRLRRENREINARVARTPSGRPLGFDLPA